MAYSPKDYRKEKKVELKQLAAVLKRSVSYVSQWESAGYRPKKAHTGKTLLTDELHRRAVDECAKKNLMLLKLPKNQRAKRERALIKVIREKLRDPLLYMVKQAIREKSRRS